MASGLGQGCGSAVRLHSTCLCVISLTVLPGSREQSKGVVCKAAPLRFRAAFQPVPWEFRAQRSRRTFFSVGKKKINISIFLDGVFC